MTRMNYNRPRGGYELEPWRRPAPVTRPHTEPQPVREHRRLGHTIVSAPTKQGSVHAAAYRCQDCNRHLAWRAR